MISTGPGHDPPSPPTAPVTSQVPILVVSDWLSERTQELLREQGINYFDLTGNALVRLDYQPCISRSRVPQRTRTRPSAAQLGSKDQKPPASSGSFAAARLAPVAAPRLLVAYTPAPAELLQQMDILPVDDGANVALLQPADDVAWHRTTKVGGYTYVGPSQAAVDCLTGNGRMPSEGEALLDWMTANEDTWRLQELPTYQEPGR